MERTNLQAYPNFKTAGLLTATYEFYENKNLQHVGSFQGQLQTKWLVDENGHIKYDDTYGSADGYYNNAMVEIIETMS